MKNLTSNIFNKARDLSFNQTTNYSHYEDAQIRRLIKDLVDHILQLPSKEEVVLQPGKPRFVVPYNINDKAASHKPLPFIDGLRKADTGALSDPLVRNEHRNKSGLVYEKKTGSLFVDGIDVSDIKQGSVGDCYFLAALTSIAHVQPDFITKNIRQNTDNTYTVGFHSISIPSKRLLYDEKGAYYQTIREAAKYCVDNDLPQWYGNNLYARGENTNELWAALYEKAYASFKGGGYDGINGGTIASAYYDLLGVASKTHKHQGSIETTLYNTIQTALDNKSPVTVGKAPDDDGAHLSEEGLVYNHAYSVLGVFEQEGKKYITLRNPYGYQEWTGEGADSKNDGTFSMPFADYRDNFYETTIADYTKYEGIYDPFVHPKYRL
jgi:hypothetical protein